jgi:polysaccharide deacetylase family protein (PEP-CTERM system associated)
MSVNQAAGQGRNGGVLNAMTVDVEDYFHASALAAAAPSTQWTSLESRVEANTDRLLALFHEMGVTATFFVLGWVAGHCPGVVRRIAAGGHEVASHGYAHALIYDQTPQVFREDVRRAKGLLEDLVGVGVVGYRAPSFSITRRSMWAFDVLLEEGYRYDASVFPVHHDRYGVPDAPRHPYAVRRTAGVIIEIPPSTVRIAGVNLPIAGGGYFRLLPYMWTAWGIGRVNHLERRPVIFYVHPWEVDPRQPRLRASSVAVLRHYRHLEKTEPRLRRLLGEFRFGRICDVIVDDTVASPAAAVSARLA